mmetsp:Transcript_7096/g.16997  ORF Transcript_7096/g.16997 Transcript_7096/m.16997 type:complete len:285 (+) Transcript_7096:968-1822(+)
MSIDPLAPLHHFTRQGELDLEAGHVSGHGSHGLLDDLNRQLPGGGNAKGLDGGRRVNNDAKQHAHNEGRRLSRTGLGLADDIPRRIGQDARQGLLLDGRRPLESHLEDGIEQMLRQVELLECLGRRQMGGLIGLNDLEPFMRVLLLVIEGQFLQPLGQLLGTLPLGLLLGGLLGLHFLLGLLLHRSSDLGGLLLLVFRTLGRGRISAIDRRWFRLLLYLLLVGRGGRFRSIGISNRGRGISGGRLFGSRRCALCFGLFFAHFSIAARKVFEITIAITIVSQDGE